jgi:hypothetical protein
MSTSTIVCSMCGDVGFSDKLFRCARCRSRFQHSYVVSSVKTGAWLSLFPSMERSSNLLCTFFLHVEVLHELLRRRGPGGGGRVRLVPQRRRHLRREAAAASGGRGQQERAAAAFHWIRQRRRRQQGHRRRSRWRPQSPQVQAPQGRPVLASYY